MTKTVVCELCGSFYGIDSQDVIAVDNVPTDITLKNVPRFTEGAVIFRNEPVAVLGMRILFKMDWHPVLSKVPEPEETSVVFMECGGMKMGFRFDRVVELADIPDGKLQKIPLVPDEGSTSYIKGVAQYGDGFMTVIEPDRLISDDSKTAISKAIIEAVNDDGP